MTQLKTVIITKETQELEKAVAKELADEHTEKSVANLIIEESDDENSRRILRKEGT